MEKKFVKRRIEYIVKQKKQRPPSDKHSAGNFREIRVASKSKLSLLEIRQLFGFRVTPPDKIKSIRKSHAKLEETQTGFKQVFTWKYNVELAKHQPVLLPPLWISVQFFVECMRIRGKCAFWRSLQRKSTSTSQ